jgi:hypothetical protein
MAQQTVPTIDQVTFSAPEQQKLQELRNRYGDDRDIFTPQEKERIRFLRWLYQNGRISS